MTTPTPENVKALADLADRVESATGPDRELDCLIWAAINGWPVVWTGSDDHILIVDGHVIGSIDPGKHSRNFSSNRPETGPGKIPAYTASLDAAMSLVLEGQESTVLHEAWRDVSNQHALHIRFWKRDADGDYAQALTRQIAAAALRARAHIGASHD